jgi:hypothetical protein
MRGLPAVACQGGSGADTAGPPLTPHVHMRMRSTEAAHGASGQTYKLGVEMR